MNRQSHLLVVTQLQLYHLTLTLVQTALAGFCWVLSVGWNAVSEALSLSCSVNAFPVVMSVCHHH